MILVIAEQRNGALNRASWETVAAAPDPGVLVRRVRQGWAPLEQAVRQRVAALADDAPVATRRAVSEDACAEALQVLARLEAELGRA